MKSPVYKKTIVAVLGALLIHLTIINAKEKSHNKLILHEADTTYHLSADDIKIGGRIFYGLRNLGEGNSSCISCHNIKPTSEFSWNPSALEIARKLDTLDIEYLKQVVLEPGGKKMMEVHNGYSLSDEDIIRVKGFLKNLSIEGTPKPKPVITKLLIFIGWTVLLILVIVDLTLTKKIKFKPLHLLLILISIFFITKTIVYESIALGRQKDYAPSQPIKFSHKVHAGVNGTDCFYCHNFAEQSKTAGIPSLNVCMNCHNIVREGTNSGRFEIDKIIQAHENNIPVEWIRIHNLPDHVFFSHAQHVGVGKLECTECHGPVEEMDVLKQHSDLSMGWCLECHRTRKVQFVDNEYYKTFMEYHEKIVNHEMDSITVEQIGGTNCMKCHY